MTPPTGVHVSNGTLIVAGDGYQLDQIVNLRLDPRQVQLADTETKVTTAPTGWVAVAAGCIGFVVGFVLLTMTNVIDPIVATICGALIAFGAVRTPWHTSVVRTPNHQQVVSLVADLRDGSARRLASSTVETDISDLRDSIGAALHSPPAEGAWPIPCAESVSLGDAPAPPHP